MELETRTCSCRGDSAHTPTAAWCFTRRLMQATSLSLLHSSDVRYLVPLYLQSLLNLLVPAHSA